MTVSVIMPAFNAGSTIAKSIGSVLTQGRRDWELVVVDDGSLDDTVRIVSTFDDSRIILIQIEHAGVCAARNRGIAAASGEILTFLDADDIVDASWLAELTKPFETDPQLGLVCCGGREFIDNRLTGEYMPESSREAPAHVCLFLASTYAVRRSVLVASGTFDEQLRFGENNDLGLRVIDALSELGMRSKAVDRSLSCFIRSSARNDRRDLDRLQSVERTLSKYEARLATRPSSEAHLQRLAAVNATRVGYRRHARHHAWRALRLRPNEVASWATVAGVWIPGFDRRWCRSSAVSDGGCDSVPDPSVPSAPHVSVLVPVHNAGATIGRAVDSVLAQTFTDYELIVVDDGSTDDTPTELATRSSDPRLRVVRHDHNRGLVATLNHGLALCRGQLVARLDADDWSSPTRLARQVALFRRAPAVVLVASAYHRVDEDGRLIREGSPPTSHAAFAIAMLTGNRALHSTVMFRRDAARSVGGYDPSWFPVEDYDLWLRMLDIGEFAALTTVETSYTAERVGSISSRYAVEQDRQSWRRSRRYLESLIGGPVTDVGELRFTVRDVARATHSLRRRLQRRDVSMVGLDRQALTVANWSLRDRSRAGRALGILIGSPRLAIVGRLRH